MTFIIINFDGQIYSHKVDLGHVTVGSGKQRPPSPPITTLQYSVCESEQYLSGPP